ncbi:MAG TPA: PspC domain-containing protein [Allosphingosinicella sp.]|jgi:phage shock protein C
MTTRFALDKENGKLMGVCSGLARWTDADPTLLRVGTVILALVAGPVAAVAYIAAGMVAESR